MDGNLTCGVAGPQGACQLRGIAAEPQVGGVVGGTCLAGIGLVHTQSAGGTRAAALHDAGQDVGHCRGLAGGEHLRGVIGVLVQYRASSRINLGDGDRLAIVTAVGKRGIGRGHLERRDGAGAERHDGNVLDIVLRGIDAELLDERHDLVIADGLCNLDIAGVGGVCRRLLERDGAVALVGVVLHLGRGALSLERRVAVEGDVGVHAVLDGSGQRKGLKRGAHGTLGRGVVHVVLGVDDDHAHVQAVERKRVELGTHGLLGSLLHRGVDGGLDS